MITDLFDVNTIYVLILLISKCTEIIITSVDTPGITKT